MTKNQVHEWHENRPEDGRKRYFRAYWNSKVWIFRKTDPEDEDWVLVDPPTPKLWQDLHGCSSASISAAVCHTACCRWSRPSSIPWA